MTALSWTRGQRSDQTAAHTAVIAPSPKIGAMRRLGHSQTRNENRTIVAPFRQAPRPSNPAREAADLPRGAFQTDSNCHRALAVGCSVCVKREKMWPSLLQTSLSVQTSL